MSKQRFTVFETLSLNVIWFIQDDLGVYTVLVVGFCLREREQISASRKIETLSRILGGEAHMHMFLKELTSLRFSSWSII